MLTTYASDSQLRAWFDGNGDDYGHNTYYFDDQRFQSSDDDDDEEDEDEFPGNRSGDCLLREEDLQRLQADEELDWYSELEAFELSPNHTQVRMKRC